MNLLSSHDKFKQAHPADGALTAFRQAGYDYVLKQGLPTRKNEDWHYTSVKVLSDVTFTPGPLQSFVSSQESLKNISEHLNPAFTNIVFVNGLMNEALSDDLPSGVTLQELSEYPSQFDDTFDALNGAFLTRHFAFVLAKETLVEKPVHFVFYTAPEGGGQAPMSHPRIRFEVGARSSIRLLEAFYGPSQSPYFVNSVFDLHVADNAKVSYARVQGEGERAVNIGRTRIRVGKSVALESLVLATGASLSRHSLDVFLQGPGSTSEILGVYAVSGTQHVDNTTLIAHAVGECNSNQLYKGILDGESRAVFCGKVLIEKGAQKASSAQLNNNLLLSSRAEADSKPCLDIFADDVKAAHGSTVGQLNAEELFYLQSRAISRDKAIPMLSYGFLSEVIDKVSDSEIQRWLLRHLHEAFGRFNLGR